MYYATNGVIIPQVYFLKNQSNLKNSSITMSILGYEAPVSPCVISGSL